MKEEWCSEELSSRASKARAVESLFKALLNQGIWRPHAQSTAIHELQHALNDPGNGMFVVLRDGGEGFMLSIEPWVLEVMKKN